METTIDEIATDVFRLSTFVPDANIMFNQFVVRGEQPLLFHTGPRALFPLVSEAIGRVVPLDSSVGSRSVTSRPTNAAR